MTSFLYRLTGWRIFRPSRTPWGESTALWSDVDWDWFNSLPPNWRAPPIDPNVAMKNPMDKTQ